MDRQIGPNFELGIHGPPFWSKFWIRDPWHAILVRIFKKRYRNPWTAKLVRILNQGSMDRHFGQSFELGIHGLPNRLVFFNWDAGIHEPLNNGIKPWFLTFLEVSSRKYKNGQNKKKTEPKNPKWVEPKIKAPQDSWIFESLVPVLIFVGDDSSQSS